MRDKWQIQIKMPLRWILPSGQLICGFYEMKLLKQKATYAIRKQRYWHAHPRRLAGASMCIRYKIVWLCMQKKRHTIRFARYAQGWLSGGSKGGNKIFGWAMPRPPQTSSIKISLTCSGSSRAVHTRRSSALIDSGLFFSALAFFITRAFNPEPES